MTAPLRAQYLRLKQPFPDALLLFRLGDVYELYDADARVAACELGLLLTARAFADGECVTMGRLRYHAAEGHIKRLVGRGYMVAIAEQIVDLHTTEDLVEREVMRVVTPASAIDGHHRPPPGATLDRSVAASDGCDTPPSSREIVASVAFTSGVATTTGVASVAAPASATDGEREERATAPAVQLTLFTLPTESDDRGR